MNYELTTYNEILLMSLRPWMNNYSDTKFKELLTETKVIDTEYNPFFSLEYKKPLTPKKKYYSQIINNERNSFLNEKIDFISKITDTDERFYIIKKIFKHLNNLFKKTADCIQENGFPYNEVNSTNQDLSNNVYIFHLLKLELVLIYIELQEHFQSDFEDEYLTYEELLEIHFHEFDNQSFINRIENTLETEIKKIKVQDITEKAITQNCFKIIDSKNSKTHINDLFTALANLNLLDESSKKDFVHVFSNRPIENKIEWIGMKGDLYSFILFLNQEKKLDDPNYKHWITTSKIFQLKGKIDFSESEIRSCKPTKQNEAKILKIVQNIRL